MLTFHNLTKWFLDCWFWWGADRKVLWCSLWVGTSHTTGTYTILILGFLEIEMMLISSSLMVQARWPQARKSTVSVCWLVETISVLTNIVRACMCATCYMQVIEAIYMCLCMLHVCDRNISSYSKNYCMCACVLHATCISVVPNIVHVCVHVACMWQKHFFLQPNFCSRLVDYACSVLSDGRGSALLEPQRLVTLHHIATLLETFVQNSPTLVQLMRSKFMEEFRCVVIN